METPQIIEFYNQRLLTTEQLAEFYGASTTKIKQNFNNNKDRFIEGKHFYRLEGTELKDFKNRVENFDLVGKNANTLILYTKQGASRHSKMLGTDQAWDMFDELEENYFNPPQQQFEIPTTLPEALRLAADVTEQNEALKLENKISEQIISELKPKADYYDSILRNKNLVTITVIAKNYGMSGTEMNKLLHEFGVQFRQGGTWLMYRKYQDKGYTHTEMIPVQGTDKPKPSTKWTQKGHIFIYQLLKENGILPMIER